MTPEAAFLQAIRETPHDDAPRLIYADWLEEQGGAGRAARADFIRLQCRLEQMPDNDAARDRLEDEAADLLAAHEAEWTQPLRGIAEDWRFTRGFVEHIRICGENLLTHAERLFESAPLRSLHLLIRREDVPPLAACPQLQWVETLDFHTKESNNSVNDSALQKLLTSPHLHRLAMLGLAGNHISTAGMQALISSPILGKLIHLDLSRNRSFGGRALRLLAHAPPAQNLHRLSLAHTNITIASLPQLFQSPHLAALTDLNLAGVQFIPGSNTLLLQELSNSRLLKQLRRLDLSETAYPDRWSFLFASPRLTQLQELLLRGGIGAESADAQMLGTSAHLTRLTLLDLRNNNLGDRGMQVLAFSPHLASLQFLNISHNVIRDRGAKALAISPYLKRLSVLNLTHNNIGGPGLSDLAGSASLALLRTLHLAGNFIRADSVRALAESAHLRRLTYLDLSDASQEEESARILASSTNLTWLTTLLLKKNRLGDGGAKELAQSPHLTRLATLDLSDNLIGKAGAEALAAATWRRMRNLDLRGNVFTDTEETLLRNRFGNAVQL